MRKKITMSQKVLVTVIAVVLLLSFLLPINTVSASEALNPSTKITVTYDPNGGIGKINEVTVGNNADYTIQDQGYTRNPYMMGGWNTMADGSGTFYSNNNVINITESITLYAQWLSIAPE